MWQFPPKLKFIQLELRLLFIVPTFLLHISIVEHYWAGATHFWQLTEPKSKGKCHSLLFELHVLSVVHLFPTFNTFLIERDDFLISSFLHLRYFPPFIASCFSLPLCRWCLHGGVTPRTICFELCGVTDRLVLCHTACKEKDYAPTVTGWNKWFGPGANIYCTSAACLWQWQEEATVLHDGK